MSLAELKIRNPRRCRGQVRCITSTRRRDPTVICFPVAIGVRRAAGGSFSERFVEGLPPMNLRIVQELEGFVAGVAVVIVITSTTGKEEIPHHHLP